MKEIMDFLKEEGISPKLIQEVQEFSAAHPVKEELNGRIPVPHFYYYGKKVWEEALAALLCGKNLLLSGEKATGKNVLAENLAAVFGRPAWDISFHVNMDASSLIGTDTFRNGKVEFRPGPVYSCACNGGFGIFDEINMARNEALASRFVVIRMPALTLEDLQRLLREQFPDLSSKYNKQFGLLFMDIQKKCESGELTSKAMDLRGLLDAISLMHKGIPVRDALDLGVTNKIFDSYEQALLSDVMNARISMKLKASEVFDG